MPKKIPLRQCIGCMEMKPKKELIRILRKEDGSFTLDATGKMNGRGAYMCFNQDCLAKAIIKKGLERSFKMKIPPEVYETLSEELKKIDK